MQLNTTEELINSIAKGQMLILMDDEDRENEGDLIMAAQFVTASDINFMIKHARGLVCMPLTRERCELLNLPLMTLNNASGFGTKFTVSIEAKNGVTTGISAADRAKTVQAAIASNAKAEDIVSPGHIFPLMAHAGGVLGRAGHTEAACDLARLAGLEAAGVICEIINDDGTMARRPQLEQFASKHNLKIGTIADLINYRLKHERTVQRVATKQLKTKQGEFNLTIFKDNLSDNLHLALTLGAIALHEPTLVRVHNIDLLQDVLGVSSSKRWSLQAAMSYVAKLGGGVVLLLNEQQNNADILARLNDEKPLIPTSYSTVGIGSQILHDLGVRKMRLLSSPLKFNALSGFDLEIVEYIPFNQTF